MNQLNLGTKAGRSAMFLSGPSHRPECLLRSLQLLGLGLGASLLFGCSSGSSGSGNSTLRHASSQYAVEGEPTYADRLEAGENLDLPMYTEGFRVTEGERELDGNEANFRMRMGTEVTIETAGRSFIWEGVSADSGTLAANTTTDTTGDEILDTQSILGSQYLDFVHFGYWQENQIDVKGELAVVGGAFRHGLETNPENMPTAGSATYSGTTLGVGTHATEGDYAFEGSLGLNADFATGNVTGTIETFFNNIALSGSTSGNAIAGEATVTDSPGKSVSFAPGTSGNLSGTFFGPAAEEVGGVWSLQDDNNLAVGGFGGKQP